MSELTGPTPAAQPHVPPGTMPWAGVAPWTMPQMMTPHMWGFLLNLLQMLESSLVVDEVAAALHSQALTDATVRDLPGMDRFADLSRHNVHAKLAAAGFLRRVLSGDWSPAVMAGLRNQLGVVQRTHRDLTAALTLLFTPAVARRNEALQMLSHVIGVADQAYQSLLPMMSQVIPEVTPAH